MKLKLLLALAGAAALSSCVIPEDVHERHMALHEAHFAAHHHGYVPATRVSDYQPNLAAAYRAGYNYGHIDRDDGYPRQSHRAYLRWGGGYESYFQEGYADGYDNTGMRH